MVQFESLLHAGIVGLGIILAGMIKIPPIKINFWNWLGRIIGRIINGEVLDKVDILSKEVDQLRRNEELKSVRRARQRILRFNDELLFGRRHSKEHFDEVLEDIDMYERYCNEHPEYENHKAELAIITVQKIYRECLQNHDFLEYNDN